MSLEALLDDLLQKSKERFSEEDFTLLKSVSVDASKLLLRKARGEEVDGELELVKATALNMSAVVAEEVRNIMLEATGAIAKVILSQILPLS